MKSGRAADRLPGLKASRAAFRPDRVLLVGSGGIPVEDFLLAPVAQWVGG